MKIAFVLGTRPEIIKLSSMILFCEQEKLDYFIIHTNQHYAENLDKIFFKELHLPDPQYHLKVGSGKHGWQTGTMMMRIESVLEMEKPDVLLVQGDTNSVLAGALAAVKMGIKIGHVEAGLRSYDWTMPEEINRVIVDHIADWLFCPTEIQRQTLLREGVDHQKIFVTGNTVVDAVMLAQRTANKDILNKYNLNKRNYVLLTMHRPSNVDEKEILALQLNNISLLAIKFGVSILYPIHPRTQAKIDEFKLDIPFNIKTIQPVGYLEMVSLQRHAKIILTDSGGVQEEACVLRVPTLCLRKTTDRPESVDVGASKVVGTDLYKLLDGFDYYNKLTIFNWANPYGNGTAYKKIMRDLKRNFSSETYLEEAENKKRFLESSQLRQMLTINTV